MKAIRIDVVNKTIEKVEIDGKLQDLYDNLKCEVVTAVFSLVPEVRDDLYVDDEALIKDLKDIPGGFFADFYNTQPLFGHGLLVGHDPETGEMTDCRMTLKEARRRIKFLKPAQVKYFHDLMSNIPPTIIPF